MEANQHIDDSRLSWYEQSLAISGQYLASCFNFRGRKNTDSNMRWELPLKLPILYARPILTDNKNCHMPSCLQRLYCTYCRSFHQNSGDRTIHSQPECYKKHATGRKDHLASKVKCDSDHHFRLICFGKAIQSQQWHH